jgi:hypothetical protein
MSIGSFATHSTVPTFPPARWTGAISAPVKPGDWISASCPQIGELKIQVSEQK